jgi:hypothetical protein
VGQSCFEINLMGTGLKRIVYHIWSFGKSSGCCLDLKAIGPDICSTKFLPHEAVNGQSGCNGMLVYLRWLYVGKAGTGTKRSPHSSRQTFFFGCAGCKELVGHSPA